MQGYTGMRVEKYFELVFCYLGLLDCFVVSELNVCKLSFGGFMLLECYVLRLIALNDLSC